MTAAIGTVRPEEAQVFNDCAGYHEFHLEGSTDEMHGSFEVFWSDGTTTEEDEIPLVIGWYWWACFPGCTPDGEPSGPFATSTQALHDADEWHPDNK